MEIQGTIKKITELQTFASGFQKREMVITTQEQYPQPINIEFLGDKINLLDGFSEGENVKVSINLRGREWTNQEGQVKYFNSIVGWRVEKIFDNGTSAAPTQASATPTTSTTEAKNDNPFSDEEEDDLPF